MYKLFVYGTLKLESVQKKLLGHTLESYDAKLQGYSVNIAEEYYNVVPNEKGCIIGKVLLINEEDFLRIDQWEEIPLYLKAQVVVNSQFGDENVYIYIKKDIDTKIELRDDIEYTSNNENLEEVIEDFVNERDEVFPVCDIYLHYPIQVNSFAFNITEHREDFFTKKFKDIVDDEYGEAELGKLEHYFIGYEDLIYKYEEKDVTIRASLYYTVDNNELGILTVMLPVCACSPLSLWIKAFEGKLRVGDSTFAQYLCRNYKIKVLSTPKLTVFASKELTEFQKLQFFVVEELEGIQIINESFIKRANTNIAQYDSAKIYASENVIIEIPKNFKLCYKDRIESQILTLFVAEIFIFQSATIFETKKYIEDLIANEDISKKKFKESVTVLLIKSKRYWDRNQFLYPTARKLAENIGEAMKVDELHSYQDENEKMLDKLVQMNKLKQEEIESSSLNAILLIISLLGVIPIVSEMVIKIYDKKFNSVDAISYIISILSCFFLWILYKIGVQIRKRMRKNK